jgi:hypothetical protein
LDGVSLSSSLMARMNGSGSWSARAHKRLVARDLEGVHSGARA